MADEVGHLYLVLRKNTKQGCSGVIFPPHLHAAMTVPAAESQNGRRLSRLSDQQPTTSRHASDHSVDRVVGKPPKGSAGAWPEELSVMTAPMIVFDAV